ncbi:hypothetical protein BC936DRAFT_144386 [Jimgerdemannia flammicorona]|uniref:Methyltransferase domain-containing protein n=1 Tax=Jimgerdemannia flammicorona TaxID=994334 RepID=A0A433DCJ3_9FUNG|nr:hypothetical protein BC936DRAFT_144386 [Jimgerdemannia flammicorona]
MTGAGSEVPEGFKVVHRRRECMPDGNTKYMLPCPSSSAEEINRLDSQHYVLRHIFHGNYSAPVEDALVMGITVLDIGCGSGRWLLDMVSFDLIIWASSRHMMLVFTPSDWVNTMRELVRVAKPGGWVELLESDSVIQNCPASGQLFAAACMYLTSPPASNRPCLIFSTSRQHLTSYDAPFSASYCSHPSAGHRYANGPWAGRHAEERVSGRHSERLRRAANRMG